MSHEEAEDVLSGALFSLYNLAPITLSSAGALFTYESPDPAISKVTIRTPDTDAANWSLHASSIWAASRFVADHLDALDEAQGTRTGASAGLPSIVLARKFPEVSVVASDYPDEDIVRTLSNNVAENGVSGNCRVMPYGWGSDPSALFSPDGEKFDIVFAADTLWNTEFHPLFIKALQLTLKKSPHARVYVFAGLHTGRYTVQSFLNAVSEADFILETALERETNGEGQRTWSVDRGEGEEENERRRWIVCLTLRWK
ncbi:hypothetical protein FB45DRAFT_1087949 [Roridomyces roridus]|uniref:Nicotinamide N-methyltransferase n=1 Tax=Roridomyces roridus TaxID=1738132 RepID=A0AAD7BJR7_9AGAR|nr:hypothetical protein FB45DRAFT_1087949 [Roridomyces roridus]